MSSEQGTRPRRGATASVRGFRCAAATVALLAGSVTGPARAAEEPEAPEGEAVEAPTVEVPIKASAGIGYEAVDLRGSARALEYETATSEPVIQGMIRATPHPQRIHVEGTMRGVDDYHLHGTYSYGDTVRLALLSRSVYHNMDERSLIDLETDPRYAALSLDGQRPGGLATGMHSLRLRLNCPGYPAHVYADGWLVSSQGRESLEFLGGRGYYDDLTRVRVSRERDWLAYELKVGADAHLGPVELDFSHREGRLDRNEDSRAALYQHESEASRPAYPTLAVSDIRTRTDVLRAHTASTGELVAALTLSRSERRSQRVGVSGTDLTADGALTWRPLPRFSIRTRARARTTDWTGPETVALQDATAQVATALYERRAPVATKQGYVSAGLKYRPLPQISMVADVRHAERHRRGANRWRLPATTVADRVEAGLRLRPLRRLKLTVAYVQQSVQAPGHNTVPSDSKFGKLSVHLSPNGHLHGLVTYEVSRDRTRRARYTLHERQVIAGSRKRMVHRASANITAVVPEDGLSVSVLYHYADREDAQTLIFDDFRDQADYLSDDGALYRESVHVVSGAVSWNGLQIFEMGARAQHVLAKASLLPSLSMALQPTSIGDFSRNKTAETRLLLFAKVTLFDAWQIGVTARRIEHRARGVSSYSPGRNGRVDAVLVKASRAL